MVRRGDDPLVLDVRGTAFDVLPETDFLVVAGRNALTSVTIGASAPSATSSWVKLWHNRNLVRLLKFNPLGTGCFASVSGPFVDVFTLGHGSKAPIRLASVQAQSHKVSDFCWCPFDDQLMLSCAEGDSVSFWDLRTDLSRPSVQLGLLFGAGQAKFAPHLNNLVLSANGSDLRLWDLRHTSHPVVQFSGHQSRILCLDWHPHHQEPNSFFTSAYDGALKLWSLGEQKSTPAVLSIASISAWRLVFSQEGEELAALSLSPPHTVTLFSNYGLENARLLKGIEPGDTLMDAAWHKSTSALKSTTKYLYTLSKKRRLCRHAIAYELSNEIRDEMATPITQSAVDEERDRLVAAAAVVANATEQQHHHQQDNNNHMNMELLVGAGRAISVGSVEDATDSVFIDAAGRKDSDHRSVPPVGAPFPRQSIGSHRSSSTVAHGSMPTGTTATLKSLIGSLKAEGGGVASGLVGVAAGLNTPQSPIYSDWHRWIRAPNVADGDLLTELEALRKHTTEGLYTTEVNFQRAAIGFSYMHQNRHRKICWEMRFHREFIENGLVFVEVIQKDSPLTAEKASLFLTMFQQESDEQVRIVSPQTVLCRVFHQLPRIIDAMQIFTPSIDVPSDLCPSKASSQSGSASEDPAIALASAQHLGDLALHSSSVKPNVAGTVLFPVTYTPSSYDHRVPAPRNCGARFNKSGYLVTFGRVMNTAAATAITTAITGRSHHQYHHHRSASSTKAATAESIGDNGEVPVVEVISRFLPPSSFGSRSSRRPTATTTSASKPTGRGGDGSVSSGKRTAVHPRSLAEYCVLVNPPLGFPSTATIFRQTSTMAPSSAASTVTAPYQCGAPFQCSPPVRCVSPHRPASPWTRPSGGSSIAVPSPQQQQQQHSGESGGRGPNSLSPPLLLKQQQQQQTGIGRILGSSPNSSSVSGRTHSLHYQHHPPIPALSAMMRQRVATMGGIVEAHAAGCAPSPSVPPPIQHQLSAMAELGTTGSLGALPSAVMPEQSFSSTVCVYDAVTLLPISQTLAHSYKLLGDSPLAICRHNREQAARKGRRDLLTLWKLLEQSVIGRSVNGSNVVERISDQKRELNGFRFPNGHFARVLATNGRLDAPWAVHPFGRGLINRLLDHYLVHHDLQTAAVITCVLNGVDADGRRRRKMSDQKYQKDRGQMILMMMKKKNMERKRGSGSVGNDQKLERPKIVDQRRRVDPRPTVDTEQVGGVGLMFAMDQTDSSSTSRVPPAPPVPPLLPSQQIPSRKASAVMTTNPLVANAAAAAWSRQSSDSNAAFLLLQQQSASSAHPARTMSDAFATPLASADRDRLSPAPADLLTPYRRSTTMEQMATAAAEFASTLLLDNNNSIRRNKQQQPDDEEEEGGEQSELLLDPALNGRYEELRRRYADLLYRWRMYRKCAEVLKHCAPAEGDESTVGRILALCWCSRCGQQQSAGSKCANCGRTPIYCAICEQPCRGVVVTCSSCSHGGHFSHLAAWFDNQSKCPLGCGCECKF